MWESNQFGMDLLVTTPRLLFPPLASPLNRPFALAPSVLPKEFKSDHFALNYRCRVAKLSSLDILKIISDTKVCPSCTHAHEPNFECKLTFFNGASKVCPKGCKHNGFLLHGHACMHSNHTPSFSVSKVASNRSITLAENIPMGAFTLGIQYDSSCQLSLIS